MNLLKRFFRDPTEFITEKGFASTRELADAIIAFLAERNKNPRRYVWKAKGEDILRKINAARQALTARQPQGNAISKDGALVVSFFNQLRFLNAVSYIFVYTFNKICEKRAIVKNAFTNQPMVL